jgi:hypothetical protein
MLKIISTKPRTYRAKRKSAKPRKLVSLPTSATRFLLKLTAIICALVSLPFLLIAALALLFAIVLFAICAATLATEREIK